MSSLKDIQDKYPVFEANQVLSNRHLNGLFDYLDKQERLTRTHLVGIGIVCGFEVEHTANAVTISKGCGVTSEGYLIKTDDLALTHYKPFAEKGKDINYEPFQENPGKDKTLLGSIVELTDNKDVAQQGTIDANLLKDRDLVFYIELRNEGLRNCSPNNCDDKGSSVTAIVRTLLVSKGFQDKYITAKGLPPIPRPDTADFPALKLPRIDVPRTGLADSQQVLFAFVKAINEIEAFERKATNILGAVFAKSNAISKKFSFIQNFYDHLDDLIQAINEYKSKVTDLICTCCPHNEWFPQHLILGTFNSDGTQFSTENRTIFMASPAITDCEKAKKEANQLKQRIKLLIKTFEIEPQVKEIRITPTKMGAALSKKAIPYYYDKFNDIRKVWNHKKTLKGKDNQILGYHAPDQNDTAYFAKEPLNLDLEPYNFLRIEGHLGRHYQEVLGSLIEQKAKYRLPIDVIALRTGSFDESIKIDFEKEKCHFEDLEAIYDAFREELRCSLGKTIVNLGGIKIPDHILTTIPSIVRPPAEVEPILNRPSFTAGLASTVSRVTPKTFFKTFDNDFVPAEKTLGAFMQNATHIFKESETQDTIAANKFLLPIIDIGSLIANPIFSSPALRTSLTFIGQLTTIINLLTDDLANLDWDKFQKEYEGLKKLKPETDTDDLKEVSEQLAAVISACRLDGLKSIIDEYQRRLKEVKKKQFLSNFLQKHPGIQHKAGVPLGGTFILVYHQEPAPKKEEGRGGLVLANPTIKFKDFLSKQLAVFPTTQPKITIGNQAFAIQGELLAQIKGISSELDVSEMVARPVPQSDEKAINQAVSRLREGIVIADFFLPYMCTSDCAPVQFVLPKSKPTFTYKIENCPDPQNQGFAKVTLKPQGGTAEYEMSVNGGDFQKLSELQIGGTNNLKIRDAEGIESVEKTIVIPAPISVELGAFEWENAEKSTYKQPLTIRGGISPYQVTLNDDPELTLKDQPTDLVLTGLKNGTRYNLTVTDSNTEIKNSCGYVHREPIEQGCGLPCGGLKVRSYYMLPVRLGQRNNKIAITIVEFNLEDETIIKDKSQDFSTLAKTVQFLREVLNGNPDNWMIKNTKVFNDENGNAQLLGLQIERFICQKFRLVVELTENENVFLLSYTEKGVKIEEKNRGLERTLEYQVPAFEHEDADLCAANREFQRRCQNERFEIGYDNRNQTAISLPEGIVTDWYWVKANGDKSNKPEQEIGINTRDLLVGFTKEGCFKMNVINIPG